MRISPRARAELNLRKHPRAREPYCPISRLLSSSNDREREASFDDSRCFVLEQEARQDQYLFASRSPLPPTVFRIITFNFDEKIFFETPKNFFKDV